MEIRDIIHFTLKNNDLSNLSALSSIFMEVGSLNGNLGEVGGTKKFVEELQDYIFSKYCTLQLCL